VSHTETTPVPFNSHSSPWRRLVLVALLGVGLAVVLVYPFSMNSRVWSELFNLAHAPSFFAAFLLLAGILDPSCIGLPDSWHRLCVLGTSRLILLAGALAIIGIICELLQGLVGRSPGVGDVLANGCGLLAALFWCLSRSTKRRVVQTRLTLIAAGLLLLPSWSPFAELYDCFLQQRAFPILASFERPREIHTWLARQATIERTTEWSSHGAASMKVHGRSGAVYPGANFQWPIMDWRGFETLEFDLLNPSEKPLRLEINVWDVAHASSGYAPADRFHTSIVLIPGEPTAVQIQLAEVRDAPHTRHMDLSRICSLNLFTVRPEVEVVFLVDHIRLTSGSEQLLHEERQLLP